MSTPTGAVFLSYASQDAETAQMICVALRAAGIEVWLDQSELRGGDAWDHSIREQIQACALFVPIISANAHARVEGYFRLEWKLAVDRSYRIAPDQAFLLPVVIDDTQQADRRIPDRFRELQWTRLPARQVPPAFVERVQRLLSATRSVEPRDQPAETRRSGAAEVHSGPAWLRPVLLVAVLIFVAAISYAMWERFVLPKRTAPAFVSGDKSIAVLPFVDMSEKKDQEYFADGMAEEI
ncbi:MAG: TIR domain-containing protein, partial [Gammaproteobacteria bacterium]|nr:TIR domain-containing protein [Gammaproteobacteria bacterium]